MKKVHDLLRQPSYMETLLLAQIFIVIQRHHKMILDVKPVNDYKLNDNE